MVENYVIEAAVWCPKCRATITRKHRPSHDAGLPEVIVAWNTRAAADRAPEGRDAVLEEAAKVCDVEADARIARTENPQLGDDAIVQGHKAVTAISLGMAIRNLKSSAKETG